MRQQPSYNFLIIGDSSTHGNWLSFASWFSIKMFNESPETSLFSKRIYSKIPTLGWTRKFQVDTIVIPNSDLSVKTLGILAIEKNIVKPPLVVLDQTLLLTRKLPIYEKNVEGDKMAIILDMKKDFSYVSHLSNNTNSDFADCIKCAKFDLNIWQSQKENPPFYYVNDIVNPILTVNEKNILNIWHKIAFHSTNLF